MIHQNFPSQDEGLSVVRSATPDPVNMAEVLPVLRLCAKHLGISAQVLRTLEALLSFLPPQRNHHTVFASNVTLLSRMGGMSERSLRRHIEAMCLAGLVQRSDSANRKRFTRFDPVEQRVLRFGLDLTPIFAGFSSLKEQAEEVKRKDSQLRFLKTRLRAAAARRLLEAPEDQAALDCLKAARRNLSADEISKHLDRLPTVMDHPALPAELHSSEDLTGSGGQNDRHHQSLNKEHIDKEVLPVLKDRYPEALIYAEKQIVTERDALIHTRNLAPMMGISSQHFDQAVERHSPMEIVALIWQLLQRGQSIRYPSAYFYAATLGKRARNFAPLRNVIGHTLRKLSADNSLFTCCPRTIQ